jgi:enoyl-CoA hydratase/carnithine racemase
VNALNISVRAGTMQALDRARRQADIEPMVLAAKGRTFVAGADNGAGGFGGRPRRVQINESSRFIGQQSVELHGGIGMTMELNRRITSSD